MNQETLCSGANHLEADRNDVWYDIYLDLSDSALVRPSLEKYIDLFAPHPGAPFTLGRMTLVLPGNSAPPIVPPGLPIDVAPAWPSPAGLPRAILRAAASRRHLAIIVGDIAPNNETLVMLIEAFNRDPLFGTTQPRFAESGTGRIWPLPSSLDKMAAPQSAPGALACLPFGVITPELLAAFLVVRWSVLGASDLIDHSYLSIAGALLQMLCQARRRGLRNFVVNRAVVVSSLPFRAIYPTPPGRDLERLGATYPERTRVEAEITRLAQRQLEPLLTAARPEVGDRRSLLLDCRGMMPFHNGTARCTIGFLDGFAALGANEQIDILVSPPSAAFHHLAERYPAFRQLHDGPTGEYAATVLLDQPWTLATVAELHRHALIVVFNMLDTISWDALYMSPENLEVVWRFVARHADALLYISYFTRERFHVRFPVRSDMPEYVTHLSLLEEEQSDPVAQKMPVSDHILVIGNGYDHKDLQRTLQLLGDGFPFNRIVAVGAEKALRPNVLALPSGAIEQSKLNRLIATAQVVVYPSYYEGFGIPAVEGLAYGRPVLVRSSPLWAEIAAWSRLSGQLIEFDDTASMIEKVGRILAGLPCQPLPSGVALAEGAPGAGWRESAKSILMLLENCISGADGRRWLERHDALRAAGY